MVKNGFYSYPSWLFDITYIPTYGDHILFVCILQVNICFLVNMGFHMLTHPMLSQLMG